MLRFAVALFITMTLSASAFAADNSKEHPLQAFGESLSATQRDFLARDIEAFFGSPGEQTIEPIRNWRMTFLTADFVLQRLRLKLDQDDLNPMVWRLGGPLLLIIAAKVEDGPKFLAPIPRERIHLHLRPLLLRYADEPEILEPLVRIYDHYDLWGYGDYWFVKQNLKSRVEMDKVFSRVKSITPVLNKTETRDLVKLLRQNYSNDMLAIYLLLNAEQRISADLSRESEFDLSRAFLETYKEFCAALVESRKMIMGAMRKQRSGERYRFMQDELSAYMDFYQQKHQSVVGAWESAKAKAQWIAQRDHLHQDGLIFFELFEAGKLDWQDPSKWSKVKANVVSSSAEPVVQKPAVEKKPEVLGVVIQVDFKNKSCASSLLKKDDSKDPKKAD